MRPGPIRRAAGTLGLLALVPTAIMLIKGNVTLQVAAVRAGVTLGTVILLGRIATWAVGWIADSALVSAQRSSAAAPPTDPAPRQEVTR
jgi:hypothetical protein